MARKKAAASTKATNKATRTTAGGSKADFIRSMPATMPAKQVVAEAKKAGIAVTENHVYKVRAAAKKRAAKKTTKKKAAVSKASKATKRPTTARRRRVASRRRPRRKMKASKKAFVLDFPAGTPASEIVAAAKSSGIALSANYIYNIRGAANAAKKATITQKPATHKPALRTTPRTGSAEEKFVDLVLDIGLVRAAELLGMIRERVRAMRLG